MRIHWTIKSKAFAGTNQDQLTNTAADKHSGPKSQNSPRSGPPYFKQTFDLCALLRYSLYKRNGSEVGRLDGQEDINIAFRPDWRASVLCGFWVQSGFNLGFRDLRLKKMDKCMLGHMQGLVKTVKTPNETLAQTGLPSFRVSAFVATVRLRDGSRCKTEPRFLTRLIGKSSSSNADSMNSAAGDYDSSPLLWRH